MLVNRVSYLIKIQEFALEKLRLYGIFSDRSSHYNNFCYWGRKRNISECLPNKNIKFLEDMSKRLC